MIACLWFANRPLRSFHFNNDDDDVVKTMSFHHDQDDDCVAFLLHLNNAFDKSQSITIFTNK